MTVIERVGKSFDDLSDLRLCRAARGILRIAELASLHVLHHNVKVIRIVVYFVDLNDVGVFQLHSQKEYVKHDFTLIFVYVQVLLFNALPR